MNDCRRLTFVVTLVVCGLAFTGCKPELKVELDGPNQVIPAPTFLVTDPLRPGERPLYDTIKLQDESRNVIWHLRADPFDDTNSVARFSYGQELTGFETVVEPAELTRERSYNLAVIGVAHGNLWFYVEADGSVRAGR